MAWLAAAAGGVGGGLSAASNVKKKQTLNMTQYPEFPEADAARQDWWSRLQQWGSDPNYGAITPDWADIWSNAQDKVRQYYWGSPTQMGLSGKVKASAARRGVSDTALEPNLTAMGVEEGNQIKDMATNMGIQKSNLAESGRLNWLQSLQSLTNQKPNYATTQGVTGGNAIMEILGAVLSGAGNAGGAAYGSGLIGGNRNNKNTTLPLYTQNAIEYPSSARYDKKIYNA
jgi:hypothetical protein